jgi:phosphopentomutase
MFERVICLVADGFGVGALPDASLYGDEGSHTFQHAAEANGGLRMPNFEKLGMGALGNIPGVKRVKSPLASIGKMQELSAGKDTTTGHWEIAGIVTEKPFALFPQGFPEGLVQEFVKAAKIPGVIGNVAASGTVIIDQLGEEHLKTGKPILYTSGDSVFQIAAHEEVFGLERLYEICKIARKLVDPYQIARVIARPFIGKDKTTFKRTEHRKDYSLMPERNLLDALVENRVDVLSVGKIDDRRRSGK